MFLHSPAGEAFKEDVARGITELYTWMKGERGWEKARGDDPFWDLSPEDLRKIEKDPRSTRQEKDRAKQIRKQKERKGEKRQTGKGCKS